MLLTPLGEGGRSAVQLVSGVDIVSAVGGKTGSPSTTSDYQERFKCAIESAGINDGVKKYSDRSVQKPMHSLFSNIGKTL